MTPGAAGAPVPQPPQQGLELFSLAMDVADDVDAHASSLFTLPSGDLRVAVLRRPGSRLRVPLLSRPGLPGGPAPGRGSRSPWREPGLLEPAEPGLRFFAGHSPVHHFLHERVVQPGTLSGACRRICACPRRRGLPVGGTELFVRHLRHHRPPSILRSRPDPLPRHVERAPQPSRARGGNPAPARSRRRALPPH